MLALLLFFAPASHGYNNGGNNSCNQAVSLLYPDESKQLLSSNALADVFCSREGVGFLPEKSIFGEQGFRIILSDNELVPGGEVLDQFNRPKRPRTTMT